MTPRRRRVDRGTWVALAAALLPTVAIRAALISAQDVSFSPADGVGLLTDLSVAFIVAALIVIVPSRVAALRLLLIGLWGLLQYAHYEHVMELGAGLQFTFAHYLFDPTFLRGSALSFSNPGLAVFVSIAPAILMLWSLGQQSAKSCVSLAVTGLVLAGAVWSLPADSSISRWRQRHFLADAFDSLFDPAPDGTLTRTTGEFSDFVADLSGDPIISLPGAAENVILLILEGLPATVLESIAKSARGNPEYLMKHFSAISERGLSASNFVMHQRQTNRGMFSLLCGDYPKLDHSLAKMTEYVDDSTKPCLPRVLGAAGYRTVYLQGAPLSFMYKDEFSRRAGFHEIYGNRAFDQPIHRTEWGVDDRTLLRRAVREAKRLAALEEPFFLSILTVGTHHPTVLPPRFVQRTSKDGFEGAVAFLDYALEEFMNRLEATGILDDTLLILTADESRGKPRSAVLADLLTRNWGPFVILMPERLIRTIADPYGQSDVALSILDYLGIDNRSTAFIGRSLFRTYPTGRRIFFGNASMRQTGAVDAAGVIHTCNSRGEECKEYVSNPATLFVPTSLAREPSPSDTARIQSAIRYSRKGSSSSPSDFRLPLAFDRNVPLLPGVQQMLMDGQSLHIPAGTRVEVDIQCTVEGSRGAVNLVHRFANGYKDVFFERTAEELAVGDTLQIRYVYAVAREMNRVRFSLSASAGRKSDLRIRIDRAEVEVQAATEEVQQNGFVAKPHFVVDVRTLPPAS